VTKSAQRRPRVVIITPRSAQSNAGNWHTAARWARFLRKRYRIAIAGAWDGSAADCLIALHARRSAKSIAAFANAHPDKPLIVVLTGTDLYRDIKTDPSAQRSLELATRLVVLNDLGARMLPAGVKSKTSVILQSAPALSPAAKSARRFTVAVVGHLRDEKNPALVWRMLERIGSLVPLRVIHAGAALDESLGRQATETARKDKRYIWLGDQPRAAARQLMRRAHLLLHPSVMEGGAHVVIEAITAHTPVAGSRIDGNTGLLGRDYPGLFASNDTAAAARLIERAAREPIFLRKLARACARRAKFFSPARDSTAVNKLVDNATGNRTRTKR
jgi:putative glycosyltransferase (TIGR04348 family)